MAHYVSFRSADLGGRCACRVGSRGPCSCRRRAVERPDHRLMRRDPLIQPPSLPEGTSGMHL